MLSEDHIPALRRTYLFSALDDDQLRTVLNTAVEVNLPEGRLLFEQGQSAERFYLLTEGQVKLYRLSEEGDEKVVEVIKPGRSFAEAVMFMSAKCYPVNAEALVDSRLIGFSSQTFLNILRGSVDTCLHMLGVMSQRMHWQLSEIDSLTLHNATYRLATYLLRELPERGSGPQQLSLETPKQVIASRLSIKPETLSRILTRLARDGLIEVKGSQITLLDLERLQALVDGE